MYWLRCVDCVLILFMFVMVIIVFYFVPSVCQTMSNPQDCSLNWISGALVNYNCAKLPAGRRDCSNEYGDQIHERAVNRIPNQL